MSASFLPSSVVEASAQQLSNNTSSAASHGQSKPSKPAARIIVHPDGRETLSNGEPLYTHPAVRSRVANSQFALHDACEAGDLLFVKAFFQPHPQDRNPIRDLAALERRDLYSQSPLHIALLNGRYEIAKLLLDNGASPLATLEGTPQLHILLTLCGSFPQFQVPMLQPTEDSLHKAVTQLKKTATNGDVDISTLTPQQIITSPQFPHLQSYLIRSLHLWLDKLASWPKDLFKKDDNGRNIFHLCAEYDLLHALLVLTERLFNTPTLAEYNEVTNDTIVRLAVGDEIDKRRKIFARCLVAQDNLKRNIFHYCAQYRSYHVLTFLFTFVEQNAHYFPAELKWSSVIEPSSVSLHELLEFQDRYHRTPLHFAFYHAAPFYSRDPGLRLKDILGLYQGRGLNAPIGSDDHEHYRKNYTILANDPIVKAFLQFNAVLTNPKLADKFINLQSILGDENALDIYKRTPYQHGVFNQPISGNHNAGSIPTLSAHQLTQHSSLQNDPLFNLNATIQWNKNPTFKPTLIGWSPRCFEHHTAGKITRKEEAPPPENVRRLQVLLNFTDGILRSNNFCHRVQTTDILTLNMLYYNTLIAQLVDVVNGTVGNHLDTELNKVEAPVSASLRPNLGDSKSLLSPQDQLQYNPGGKLDQFYQETPLIPQQILHWHHRSPRATFADILRCHDFSYITKLMSSTESVPETGDWSVASLETIDLLHRDLHITVPTITTGTISDLSKQYTNQVEFYKNVLQNAYENALLPHNAQGSNVTSGNAHDLIRQSQLSKRGGSVIQSPVSSMAQAILYRERAMLNLNFGHTTLLKYDDHGRVGVSKADIKEGIINAYNKSVFMSQPAESKLMNEMAESILDENPSLLYLADGFEAQIENKGILFNGADKLRRENILVEDSNTRQWRAHITPAAYTNSLIQSSSLLHLVYHYPNYNFVTSATNSNEPNLSMSDENQSLPNDQLIRSREHTSTYSYELDVLHPAPQATRHTIPPVPLRNLDEDTSVSAFSWFAALFAGGTVIDSVKRVISGQYKNAFCAVRPPGHHSGPTGLVSTDENIGDSHGFCLLNNVAIGAAHAKALYPDLIKRVAIIDFDVHHGNGTESIVQKLRPQLLQRTVHIPQTAQSVGIDKICLTRQVYSPWNDCQDVDQVLFASVHGYHKAQGDQFYPGTGSTTEGIVEAINEHNRNPYRIIAQTPELTAQQELMFNSETFTSRSQTVEALKKFFFQRENPGLISGRKDDDNNWYANNLGANAVNTKLDNSGNNILIANKTPYVSPITAELQYDGDMVAAKKASLQQVLGPKPLETNLTALANIKNAMAASENGNVAAAHQFDQSDISSQITSYNVSIYPGDLPTDIPIHQIIEARPHRILNAGLGKHTRTEWRKIWQHTIIPGIVSHNPDLIMISAGFDAHYRDKINGGHVGIDEDDYYWITKQLMKVANLCCEGRVVSCLEGGYRIHGGLVSPFARSVAAHVRALNEGGDEKWTPDDVDVELEIQAECNAEKEVQWNIKQSEGSRITGQVQNPTAAMIGGASLASKKEDEVRMMNYEANLFINGGNNSNPAPADNTMIDGDAGQSAQASEETSSSGRPQRARKPQVMDMKLMRKLDSLDSKANKKQKPTPAPTDAPAQQDTTDGDQLVSLISDAGTENQ